MKNCIECCLDFFSKHSVVSRSNTEKYFDRKNFHKRNLCKVKRLLNFFWSDFINRRIKKKKKENNTKPNKKKNKKKRYKLLRITYFFTWNFIILFVIINLTSKMGVISTNKKVCKSHGIKLEESHLMLAKISETFANWDFRKIMGYKLLRTAILKKFARYSFAKKSTNFKIRKIFSRKSFSDKSNSLHLTY